MKLYDETIKEWLKILDSLQGRELDVKKGEDWKDIGNANMILRSDMAYELGGNHLPALSGMTLTADTSLVPRDEVLLYGKDLGEIHEDTPYARLAVLRVKEDSMGEGNALYQAIRKMEYTKYHLNPEGFMMRISAASQREMVRVGKTALEKGLGFEQVGKLFLQSYHKNSQVEAVKLVFITLSDFPYEELEIYIKKAEEITKAIDHILKNLSMDCNVCSLKQICDEVEGMKELHFGTTQQ
ncbi:MAG: carbon monoxide dehydrogenase [Lachnospiraceae bacterium]|nr:carbon monoxide dehydrogenase [Lachnospiraceae bacterium]MDD7379149.1 carbon monoxide dehydrogenase [Lachnospiraceae bacterium]MDY4617137.1 carbon monoxide dehydrogenase [Lachnospiraceae bacterium]